MKIVDDTKPVISKERIFRLLGQKDREVSGRLSKKIDKHIAGMKKMMRPKVLYTTKKIRKIEGSHILIKIELLKVIIIIILFKYLFVLLSLI